MAGGKWIQGAIKRPGALRAQMGVPAGKKIPAAALRQAAREKNLKGRRARLALTLRSLRGGKGARAARARRKRAALARM